MTSLGFVLAQPEFLRMEAEFLKKYQPGISAVADRVDEILKSSLSDTVTISLDEVVEILMRTKCLAKGEALPSPVVWAVGKAIFSETGANVTLTSVGKVLRVGPNPWATDNIKVAVQAVWVSIREAVKAGNYNRREESVEITVEAIPEEIRSQVLQELLQHWETAEFYHYSDTSRVTLTFLK